MAKITMYLKGNKIESIEDIKQNFQVYELMDYMNNGALRSWLEDAGYNEYSKKLDLWSSTDRKEQKKKLYDTFGVAYDTAAEYTTTDVLLHEKRKMRLKLLENQDGIVVYNQDMLDEALADIVDEAALDDTENGEKKKTIIKLIASSHNGFEIPISVPNVYYIGMLEDHAYFPNVELEFDEIEYNQQGIFFENVDVEIKIPEKILSFTFWSEKEKWAKRHPEDTLFHDFYIEMRKKSDEWDGLFYWTPEE